MCRGPVKETRVRCSSRLDGNGSEFGGGLAREVTRSTDNYGEIVGDVASLGRCVPQGSATAGRRPEGATGMADGLAQHGARNV